MTGYASVSLPEPLWRRSVVKPAYQPEGYLDALDRQTLWYDAIWDDGLLSLVCPPIKPLPVPVKTLRFSVDGRAVKLHRIRAYRRHCVMSFRVAERPARIAVQIGDWLGESAVQAADHTRFAGRNVVFYCNKNNDLTWLADHARFHRHHHGAQDVIVLDNGSDAYDRGQIEQALSGAGVTPFVLETPFKYGPVGKAPFRRTEKYLQTALFNILRLRFLRSARAVLNCDVDELILPLAGIRVFDAACSARLGLVHVPGQWHVAGPGAVAPFVHGDHGHVEDPPKTKNMKWCLRPDGPLGGWSWDVHALDRLNLLKQWPDRRFRFAHCRGISTGWKGQGRLSMPQSSIPDPVAQRLLEEAGLDCPRGDKG